MPHRGRTTAILLATGAVVVGVLGVSNFWNIVWCFQTDSQRIRGRWKTVSVIMEGTTMPKSGYIVFEDETTLRTVMDDGHKEILSYHLDETHEPGLIDIIRPNGNSFPGIYEINRDTLRICMNRERPTTFESKPGSRTALTVLQRE